MDIEGLRKGFINLYQYLVDNKIIMPRLEIEEKDYYSLVDALLEELKQAYPNTKFKRIMKSVHYANGFNDERLKESAFKLDEIEQVLVFNKFIDHDKSVEYYNEQITKKEITQYTLTETMIESLMNG